MNPPLQDAADARSGTSGDRVADWLRNAVRVAGFSAAFGLLLTLIDRSVTALADNLVYAECIGLCIYTASTSLGVRSARRDTTRPFAHYLMRGIVAVPLGFLIGLNVAALLRGHPAGLGVFRHAALFALPLTVAATATIMYFLWSRKRLADASLAEAHGRQQIAEARLKLLQAQIEPHMLFNTLANLRTLVDVDAPRAQAMIDQLITYLRGTLAASRSATTTLEAEFAQLAAYLALMQVRMATRLRFDFDLPDDLRTATVPPMLLQPLVENAIRHGLEPKIEGGCIRVSASSSGAQLRLAVRDDGTGLAIDAAAPGYGLEHVRDRLRRLYGDDARISVVARPEGGVLAEVVLPQGTALQETAPR